MPTLTLPWLRLCSCVNFGRSVMQGGCTCKPVLHIAIICVFVAGLHSVLLARKVFCILVRWLLSASKHFSSPGFLHCYFVLLFNLLAVPALGARMSCGARLRWFGLRRSGSRCISSHPAVYT